MKTLIGVTIAIFVFAISDVLMNAAPVSTAPISGVWQLDDQSSKPVAPPIAMTVTQRAESITVSVEMLDSSGLAVASLGHSTYGVKTRSRDRSIELSTVVNPTGPAESRTTTTENWRVDDDGMLDRHVHAVGPEGTVDRVETWRRLH